jgi:hypothetical protein
MAEMAEMAPVRREIPEERWHMYGEWLHMARFLAAQWAFEDAIENKNGFLRCGCWSGPKLAALTGGILRAGYPFVSPWLTEGTVSTSKKPAQAVWIEPKLTPPGRMAFFDEWYVAVRYEATMCASWDWGKPYITQRKFVTALIDLANSIVKDTYDRVTPAAVRSAALLASAAPVERTCRVLRSDKGMDVMTVTQTLVIVSS